MRRHRGVRAHGHTKLGGPHLGRAKSSFGFLASFGNSQKQHNHSLATIRALKRRWKRVGEPIKVVPVHCCCCFCFCFVGVACLWSNLFFIAIFLSAAKVERRSHCGSGFVAQAREQSEIEKPFNWMGERRLWADFFGHIFRSVN